MKSNSITSHESAKDDHIRADLIREMCSLRTEKDGDAAAISAASGAKHALTNALSTIGWGEGIGGWEPFPPPSVLKSQRSELELFGKGRQVFVAIAGDHYRIFDPHAPNAQVI